MLQLAEKLELKLKLKKIANENGERSPRFKIEILFNELFLVYFYFFQNNFFSFYFLSDDSNDFAFFDSKSFALK